MAERSKPKFFRNAPFKDALKGASASLPPERKSSSALPSEPSSEEPQTIDFGHEMTALGVTPLAAREGVPAPYEADADRQEERLTDRDLFLEALDNVADHLETGPPEAVSSGAAPRRLKQLRKGQLQPEAQLDLHGLGREDALTRVRHFLDNARFHGLRCVLVITGRGGHSPDGPVLRNAVEAFLAGPGQSLVTEWARAPRQYGGEGALVVFLHSV